MPDFESKIIPIEGDMMEHELGISEEDRKTLCNEISIVFHSAATVRFDEPMRLVSGYGTVDNLKANWYIKSKLKHRLLIWFSDSQLK